MVDGNHNCEDLRPFKARALEIIKNAKHHQERVEEAKEQYRAAWTSWCLSQDLTQKRELEKLMDSLQSQISSGPGPEWQAFAKTLPGFLEFWNRWGDEMKEMAKGMAEKIR